MTLSYQATLEEVAEPAVRRFLRSKTAHRGRIHSTCLGAILLAVALLLVFRDRSPAVWLWSALVGAVIGGTINFLTYTPSVRARIRRHIQTESGHMLPTETVFVIHPGRLVCAFLSVKVEFSLRDLTGLSEDPGWIELSFGDKGLCTIPARVFEDAGRKAAFLQAIEANRGLGS